MKSREDLVDSLAKIITVHSDNEKAIKKMQQVYIDKKMVIRTVGLIFKNQIPLENFSKVELGVWCVYLHDELKEKLLNPEDYFTEEEIKQIRQYVERNEIESRINSLVLQNVLRVIENGKVEYRCSYVEPLKLYLADANKLLTYNFNAQRESKKTKYRNKIVEQATINQQSVTEIRELMLSNRFSGNMLTLNIRRPEFCDKGIVFKEYTPNSNLGDLIITPNFEEGIYLDITDGQHRLSANNSAVEESIKRNIELKHSFMLKIPMFTEDEAQDYINIQNQQNAMNKEHSKAYAKDDLNVFIKTLNLYGKSSTNKMYNKIGNTIDEVKIYDKYTTINILNDGLRLTNDKFDEPYENKLKMMHYINVFNTILGYYQRKYKDDIKTLKKETIALEPNVFVGYIAIGKSLMDNDNAEQVLMEMLQNGTIALEREIYNWDSLDMFKDNPKTYKKIYEYFRGAC